MRRIIYTRHDGGVTVCSPTSETLRFMTCGGGWNTGRSLEEEVFYQFTNLDIDEDTAARFVRAMMCGGLVEYEAYAIIRDRDCKSGSAHDMCDDADIPEDRWFRSAWRRSSNGGPIIIDDDVAKRVQWSKLVAAHDIAVKTQSADLFAPEFKIDLSHYRSRIKAARRWEDVRHIWPEGLPRHV